MQERIKQIPVRLLEIWKKYSKKQKVIIISAVSSVICALLLLIFLLGRTEYVELIKLEDTKTAKQAIDILKENGIAYQLKDDGVTVLVDETKKTEAKL